MSDTAAHTVVSRGSETGVSTFPQPRTVCLDRLDARPWHATLAIRTGTWCSGIRVNTRAAFQRVEEFVEPLRERPMDAVVSPNFSVEVPDAGSGNGRLFLIYRDHEIVARERDFDALLAQLSLLLDEAPRMLQASQLAVNAAALLTPAGGAVLVPGGMLTALLTRRRQLETARVRLLPGFIHTLDPESGHLVLDPLDPELGTLNERWGHPTGQRRVFAWCVPAKADWAFQLRRVDGVAATFGMVVNTGLVGPRTTLERLKAASEQTLFVGLPELPSATLARAVIEVAEQDDGPLEGHPAHRHEPDGR